MTGTSSSSPSPKADAKKPNQLLPLLRILLWKNPALIHALENRHERYNETLAYIREQERSGNLLVIRPEAPPSTLAPSNATLRNWNGCIRLEGKKGKNG